MKCFVAYCLAICGFLAHQICTKPAEETTLSISTTTDFNYDDYETQRDLKNCTKLSPVLSTTNKTYQCSHLCEEGGYADEENGTECMVSRLQNSTLDHGEVGETQGGGGGKHGNATRVYVFVNGTCWNGTCIEKRERTTESATHAVSTSTALSDKL
ncbi:uncharacterized protein LOC135392985 [Ornithodoros turicata]|uniref:uncharacterized protein LOC135392985 n=1 Tax=Ornithodoros turicata TaxID=34597 RepID=UPI003138808F